MKTMTRPRTPITLTREIIRRLTSQELSAVAGGKPTNDDTCEICDPSVSICTK